MNAYEIRLDILKLAKEILSENKAIEMETAMRSSTSPMREMTLGNASRAITAADVVSTATALYNFVGTSSEIERK